MTRLLIIVRDFTSRTAMNKPILLRSNHAFLCKKKCRYLADWNEIASVKLKAITNLRLYLYLLIFFYTLFAPNDQFTLWHRLSMTKLLLTFPSSFHSLGPISKCHRLLPFTQFSEAKLLFSSCWNISRLMHPQFRND